MAHSNKRLGFTLVELLVSISIIATLIAILMPNLMGARERARDAQKKEDLSSLRNALRMYYNDKQSYPAGGTNFSNPATNLDISAAVNSYMPSVSNIGYTFYYLGTGDSFYAWVPTEATKDDELLSSQQRCGLSVGSTVAGSYMVCAQ